jgi:hypothetical protein
VTGSRKKVGAFMAFFLLLKICFEINLSPMQGDQLSLPKFAKNVALPIFCQNYYTLNFHRGKMNVA